MDKRKAEAILGLNEPYDYSALREAWRRLCAEFHPDKSKATGMDRSYSDETLKDINEAYYFLKPLVESGGTVTPGEEDHRHQGSYSNATGDDQRALAYSAVMLEMLNAKTSADYEALVAKLGLIGDYYDAPVLMQECFMRAMTLRKEEEARQSAQDAINEELERKREQELFERLERENEGGYMAALNVMYGAQSIKELFEAEDMFAALGPYPKAIERRNECHAKAVSLQEKQHEAKTILEELEALYCPFPKGKAEAYADAERQMQQAHNVGEYAIAAALFDIAGDYESARYKANWCRGLAKGSHAVAAWCEKRKWRLGRVYSYGIARYFLGNDDEVYSVDQALRILKSLKK